MHIYVESENGVFVSSLELFVSFVQKQARARTHTHFSEGKMVFLEGQRVKSYIIAHARCLCLLIYI
jgi:hypothetical protein